MAGSSSNIYAALEKHEKDEFNQQFINYEGKKELKVQDVATLINLSKNSKDNSKFKTEVKIMVGSTDVSSQESNNWLKDNVSSNKKYKCTSVHINSDTELVDKVELSVVE